MAGTREKSSLAGGDRVTVKAHRTLSATRMAVIAGSGPIVRPCSPASMMRRFTPSPNNSAEQGAKAQCVCRTSRDGLLLPREVRGTAPEHVPEEDDGEGGRSGGRQCGQAHQLREAVPRKAGQDQRVRAGRPAALGHRWPAAWVTNFVLRRALRARIQRDGAKRRSGCVRAGWGGCGSPCRRARLTALASRPRSYVYVGLEVLKEMVDECASELDAFDSVVQGEVRPPAPPRLPGPRS